MICDSTWVELSNSTGSVVTVPAGRIWVQRQLIEKPFPEQTCLRVAVLFLTCAAWDSLLSTHNGFILYRQLVSLDYKSVIYYTSELAFLVMR